MVDRVRGDGGLLGSGGLRFLVRCRELCIQKRRGVRVGMRTLLRLLRLRDPRLHR